MPWHPQDCLNWSKLLLQFIIFLQKNLFDYIGAGTVSPEFLIKKLYEEENKKLEIDIQSIQDKDNNIFITGLKEIDNSLLIDIHIKVQAIGIFGKIIIINLKN